MITGRQPSLVVKSQKAFAKCNRIIGLTFDNKFYSNMNQWGILNMIMIEWTSIDIWQYYMEKKQKTLEKIASSNQRNVTLTS